MKERALNPARLLVESSAIFLSVLLAFFVEEWREDKDEERKAAEALNLVRAELVQNLGELERVIPTRGGLMDQYVEVLGVLRREGTFPEELPQFVTPQITSIAYELATDSGAVTIVEPEDLLTVAQAYEALRDVRRNDVFLDERNAQIRYADGEQYLSGFVYYLNRALGNEPRAAGQVRVAIEALTLRVDQD
ncbi:MAG: hypothetical protein AAGJ52_00265 [Pseudomonadota bacterium]